MDIAVFRTGRQLTNAPALQKKGPLTWAPFGIEANYFFLHASFALFSSFVQSTLVSSIFPPAWLAANTGTDAIMNAATMAEMRVFIAFLQE
jgi:hypothetical protein